MISIPVERVVFYAQIISREISGWISQIMVLIPQDTFTEEIIRDIDNLLNILANIFFGTSRSKVLILLTV